MIKVLLAIISFFLLLFLESFFLKVFSFSVFLILTVSIWKRVDDIIFYPFITLFSITLDTVLHTPLGTHGIVIILLLILADIFWFFVHRDSFSGYIGVFLFITSYYFLIPLASGLLQDGISPEFSWGRVIGIFVSSLISTGVCILVDRFVKSIRSEQSSGTIRLS
jgi:hypothetical protein